MPCHTDFVCILLILNGDASSMNSKLLSRVSAYAKATSRNRTPRWSSELCGDFPVEFWTYEIHAQVAFEIKQVISLRKQSHKQTATPFSTVSWPCCSVPRQNQHGMRRVQHDAQKFGICESGLGRHTFMLGPDVCATQFGGSCPWIDASAQT
jgi:hypothetical protein